MQNGCAAPLTRTDCQLCPVRGCMARRGDQRYAAAWNELLAPRRAVMPEQALYHNGDHLHALYTVRAGCMKTYTVENDGTEHILGFYFPGDVIGLDALGTGICPSEAAAVTPSQVCVAPAADLRLIMLHIPEVAQRIIEQTSRELSLALALSGDFTAEQRVAAFLLHIRHRLGAGEAIRRPMTQREIGNYLRLATETICRTLKSMERKGWIVWDERKVHFVLEARLRAASEPVNIPMGRFAQAA